jgi:hypothetical protein
LLVQDTQYCLPWLSTHVPQVLPSGCWVQTQESSATAAVLLKASKRALNRSKDQRSFTLPSSLEIGSLANEDIRYWILRRVSLSPISPTVYSFRSKVSGRVGYPECMQVIASSLRLISASPHDNHATGTEAAIPHRVLKQPRATRPTADVVNVRYEAEASEARWERASRRSPRKQTFGKFSTPHPQAASGVDAGSQSRKLDARSAFRT